MPSYIIFRSFSIPVIKSYVPLHHYSTVMSFAKSTEKGVLLNLVILPGSNCTGLTRIQDGQLHIDVNAAPEKNKANKEVIRFMSTLLKVDKSSVSIVSGLKSRNKIVMVRDEMDGERIEKMVLQDLDGI